MGGPTDDGHKFKIGQRVTLGSKRFGQWGEIFEVSRQMPQENGSFQYRIKSVTDGHERVVLENELS
jgi:hypothetical protein